MNRPIPDPRAPRYVAEIVRRVGAVDSRILEGTVQSIGSGEISKLAELLESKQRTLPIIAISDDDLSGAPICSPDKIASFHCGIAHVVHLDVGASWALTNLWGEKWSAYRGAVRCYLPGVNHESDDPLRHRLWFAQTVQRTDANRADGFLNLCLRHVFATATAQFESYPLLTPAAVRRQLAEATAAQRVAPVLGANNEESVETEAPETEKLIEAIPIDSRDIFSLPEVLEEQTRTECFENEYAEKIDILTAQLKSAEEQLQQARNQSAQERFELEKLKEELELYKEINSEMESKVAVLTGRDIQESSDVIRAMWASFSPFFQSVQNLTTQYKRVETEAFEKEEIEQKLDQAKDEIYSLRAQNEILKMRRQEVPPERVELRLNDADSLREFMNDQRNGVIEILPSAAKAYRDYPFNNLERMTEGLIILRDFYLCMKMANGDESSTLHAEFQERIRSGKFTFGWSAGEANRKHNEDDHTVKLPDGRRIRCEKIRDKATNLNWQFFFGVYFGWDDVGKVLYVKGFGHGESPSAHT